MSKWWCAGRPATPTGWRSRNSRNSSQRNACRMCRGPGGSVLRSRRRVGLGGRHYRCVRTTIGPVGPAWG
uniref:B1308_F1_8 n=1 Tax=Mycobacterium leprae TaxID=1769 RepID=Q49660_MYCLR|nr:B1308_F1_8 [Mycobacterium leprae]